MFARRKVPTLVEAVVVNELGKRLFYPTPQRGIDLVGKDAYGNGNGDVLRGGKSRACFPNRVAPKRRLYSSLRWRQRAPVRGLPSMTL
jgi:hypothetical protein